MRNIRLTIAYDGSGYCGWQRQKNGLSVQEELERVLTTICNEEITLHGAGRTDAGVHARAMAAHFHTNSPIPPANLQKGLNSMLPGAVRVIALDVMSMDFHARFSAHSKSYHYRISTDRIQPPWERNYVTHVPFELTRDDMRACLDAIEGCHDFASFETAGSRDRELTTGRGSVRTISRARLVEEDEHHLCFEFSGDGFLRHMIRNLMGTILEVGKKRKSPQDFTNILRSRKRSAAGATAPPHGLYLVEVKY
ncbi:MAG: tRNA pseudouridine(38-40) synthase TruA [Thermodesulfobacteriota bacterium]